MQAEKRKHKSCAMTQWPLPPLPGPTAPRGDKHSARTARGWTQSCRTSRTPAPARAVGWAPPRRPAQLGFLVGLRSPARGANHLCHTVTIILHKIIIKNPNFSVSNPASGLLAFFCGPVIDPELSTQCCGEHDGDLQRNSQLASFTSLCLLLGWGG